ncbi:TPA: hypothetical protein L9968_003781 [Klebsiella aerogenes]|uniref:hypothetical protein n=1 Tax=Klebsiella TaxID=570 RepID=UPI000B05B106|nr:hypothetical protein [Klebsiella aerogenes]EIV3803925.1 hypothetical protein [Klebsiella aerogenes]EIV7215438.1 hypothetical protein [Klebsiella aerogenes]EKW1039071.1 hypothetical protein [Klebsiella aerogenes]EKZ5303298.1 hypothetical protein [Klebsiella aerogenes]ELA1689907.1 hypothetical protein [Klebsiella aerogenes]
MRTGRILYHIWWFGLLGPLFGVPAGIITLGLFDTNSFADYLFHIMPLLPILIFFGYYWGAIPALLTGAIVGCLPRCIYNYCSLRILFSGLIGAAIAFCIQYLIDNGGRNIFVNEMLWVMASAGLFSGLVMGWLMVKISNIEESPIRTDIETRN